MTRGAPILRIGRFEAPAMVNRVVGPDDVGMEAGALDRPPGNVDPDGGEKKNRWSESADSG